MNNVVPRVVIDARPLTQNAGGFRSYTRALCAGLARLPNGGENVILYVSEPLPPHAAPFVPACAEVRVLPASRLRADLWDFRKQAKRDAPDIIHGTVNYLPPGLPRTIVQTVAIHDAFGIKTYPWDEASRKMSLRDRALNRYWRWMTRASAFRAHRVITASDTARREILSAVPGLPEKKITIIPNGILLAPPALVESKGRDMNRVLVMAAPDARKNLAVVARAFGSDGRAFWGNAPLPRLDVVCGSDKTAARAGDLLRGHGVSDFELMRGLDDAALARAYAKAGAFVWASRGEGFGLPPLEALVCGCPVVSSSAPAMPEVLGDAPLYFDPSDSGELVTKLKWLLGNSGEAQERSEQGRRHAETFTPERMARAHRAVWEAAANVGSGEA